MSNAGFVGYKLKQLMEDGHIASIFSDADDPDRFVAGFVECLSTKHVLLQSISPHGQLDGYLAKRNTDIFQVLSGDEYEQRLMWLVKINAQPHERLLDPGFNGDIFLKVLTIAKEKSAIISIWYQGREEAISGRVGAVDELYLTFDTVDFFAKPSGIVQIIMRDIDMISYDSPEEIMLTQLSNNPIPIV